MWMKQNLVETFLFFLKTNKIMFGHNKINSGQSSIKNTSTSFTAKSRLERKIDYHFVLQLTFM